MTDLMTEQEQIQQLKTWIKLYAPYVILGLLVALLVSTGFNYWQRHQNKTAVHASNIYDEMLIKRAENNLAAADIQAKKLMSHYEGTPYAEMAAFMLARSDLLKNDLKGAIKQLKWVVTHTKNPVIREIATTRLARVYLAKKQPDEALKILKETKDKAFMGLVNEIRGDAYLVKKDLNQARTAYQLALAEIPNAEVTRPLLQMKYDNLATSSKLKI